MKSLLFSVKQRNAEIFSRFNDTLWHKQRFVSIDFFALIDHRKAKLFPDVLTEESSGFYIDELDNFKVTMDHKSIILKGLLRLCETITYKPIGYNLLPEKSPCQNSRIV